MTDFNRNANTMICRRARLYSLWELSRRAGITRDQFEAWKVDSYPDHDVVWIDWGRKKRIDFPVSPPEFWNKLSSRPFEVGFACWMFPPSLTIADAIPNFVVPFSAGPVAGQPLFRAVNSSHVTCSTDLLSSILLTLSRYEEVVCDLRDNHSRFPAAASLAAEHGFVDRPIIDEYGFGFEQAVSYLLPAWTAPPRELRVKLSHDIDQVGFPFRIRPVVGHALVRRKPMAAFRDLFSALGGCEPSYLNCLRTICRLSLDRGLDSALYWKSPPYTNYDSGYSLSDRKIQAVIQWAREKGIEMGAHPGYYTYGSVERLREQFEYVRRAVGNTLIGGRQHYLRWSPETWEQWEECGFAYDSTVGYADRIGFRAGTCIPYKPWLLGPAREANLLEIPLTVMDATLSHYMGLRTEQQLERIMRVVAKCRLVGGVFTLLWHNTSLMDPSYGDTYMILVDSLAGTKRFAWEDENRSRHLDLPRTACA